MSLSQVFHHDDVVQVVLDPRLRPLESRVRSEFPHKLVTVDFDAADRIVAVTAISTSIIAVVLDVYGSWRTYDASRRTDAELLERLRHVLPPR